MGNWLFPDDFLYYFKGIGDFLFFWGGLSTADDDAKVFESLNPGHERFSGLVSSFSLWYLLHIYYRCWRYMNDSVSEFVSFKMRMDVLRIMGLS